MLRIEIRVKGQVDQQWLDWFDGLTIRFSEMDETILSGLLTDEAALYGIISRLRDLGLKLVTVSSEDLDQNIIRS